MNNTRSEISKKTGPKGRPEINSELCKGCGLCLAVCPKNVLGMSNTPNSLGISFAVYDASGNCTACKNCAIICPDRAISIYKSSGEE
jgi:2-oxoglutarate ferredoxin oxidoreductase subunit delta